MRQSSPPVIPEGSLPTAADTEQSKIYVFGDQTYNYEQSLAQLLCSDNVHLVWFFRDCYDAIRTELGRSPAHGDETPKFSSISDLLTRKRDELLSPALDQLLSLIHNLAAFIWLHSEGRNTYPTASNSRLVGFCTGGLAAAAVSASRDLGELVKAGVYAAVVALHTGLRATQVARSIVGPHSASPWSMHVRGASRDDIEPLLERFHQRKQIAVSSHAYISSVAASSLSISAPPEVLNLLTNESAFSTYWTSKLPVRSPYHAPHLFTATDVDSILRQAQSWAPTTTAGGISVLSSGTGRYLWVEDSHALMESAVNDVLTRSVLFDKTLDALSRGTNSESAGNVMIVSLGTECGHIVKQHLESVPNESSIIVTELSLPRDIRPPVGPKGRSKIAVIGMSGRFPGASSPDALWDLLQNRVDMCREVPPLRWNVNTHVDPTGKLKNTNKVKWGCWLDDPEMFDAGFFAISPREAPQIDPAQRLALMTAYEAIEQAGIVPGRTPSTREDRVGVFYGITSNDWCESNSGQDIDTYYIPGANRAFVPGRINYFFKFSGPSYAVDTACSSSLSAIHIACNSLWQHDIDTAIAGGTNVLTNPDMTTGLDKGHFLSHTGNCKTFDESADGYCRGEGVATVILKRLEDAIEDADPIIGIIGSAFTNHSAFAESITRPHVGAQKDIFERILTSSGVHPYDVSYIEMHGTGTQAGDTREINSVCDTFAPSDKPHSRAADQPLHLGALKANIGHGESVSGVSALIKVMMMMRKEAIPPHCGIKTRINPKFPTDLTARNVHIDLESTPWPRSRGLPRRALINNFSAAGGNTSLLVEEPPAKPLLKPDFFGVRKSYPVVFSARSPKSLRANVQALWSHITATDAPLPAISYTTTARRMHHHYRFSVLANDVHQLKDQLSLALASSEFGTERIRPPKQMVFAFTGQGSQYPGMGKELLETLGVFRDQIVHFDGLSQRLGFPTFLPLLRASGGDDLAAYPPVVVQLANTCMQIALARIWISWGITPTAVVGHSLGEYAALNIAGVLSDSDTIFLVGRRAQLLQDVCDPGSHAMLAVAASVVDIEATLAGTQFETACINAPRETVLAGTVAHVLQWKQKLTSAGIRNTLLRVPYAFHSSQITPICSAFRDAANGVVFRKPTIAVLSPLHGSVVTDNGVFNAEYLVRHAREPVRMMTCLQAAFDSDVLTKTSYGIEFGPHPVVSGMIKSTLGDSIKVLPTLRNKTDPWSVLTQSLSALHVAGLPIDWNGYFVDIPSARTVLELPTYQWELQPYWIAYRNDWTLTKGDIPVGTPTVAPVQKTLSTHLPAEERTQTPPLRSSSIHKVLQDEVTNEGCKIVVECDTAHEDIKPFIQGHTVDGYSLCTPAVYADMAFTIGNHVRQRFESHCPGQFISVNDMDIKRALIGSADWKQTLRCSANFVWASKASDLTFTVHDEFGEQVGVLATCQILFTNDTERQALATNLSTVKGNFERMRNHLADGKTCRFSGDMAYRLVSALADFNPDYHCVDDVLYGNQDYESACRVSFGRMARGGQFYINPAAVDGLTQSAGFSMNVNENTKLATDVFVNHGWKEFHLFERIRNDCQYSTHVRMTPTGVDALWSGDVSVFTSDTPVAMIKGVQIQGVPRRYLKFILSQAAKPPKSVAKLNKAREATAKASGAARPSNAAVRPQPSPAATLAAEAKVRVAANVLTASIPPAPVQQDAGTENLPQITKALSIIAEESGVVVSDLKDDTCLVDIGVDSLLTLMIASRFSEELQLDAEPNFFEQYGTIGEIKKFFARSDTTSANVVSIATDGPQPQALANDFARIPMPCVESLPSSSALGSELGDVEVDERFAEVLKIIADEVRVPLEQLTDDASIVDLGVDSLLSLMIGSRLRDELDIEFDTQTLLSGLDTVKSLRESMFPDNTPLLSRSTSAYPSSTPSTISSSSSVVLVDTDLPTPLSEMSCDLVDEDVPATTSVVLQGNSRSAKNVLWFFPDGSGLASSYVNLPRIRPDLVVYGMNSPYLKKGVEMNCSWDGLVHSHIAEIRRRQPSGPYSFAGWSAGGILAYRASQILMDNGEEVRDLIILDSPPPFKLKLLPEHFFEYCSTAGLLGGANGKAPDWLIAHFRSINKVLQTFSAKPLTVSTLRKVNILWACESSVDERFYGQSNDPEDMKFLTVKRNDYSAGRWGPLFGDIPVKVDLAKGQHHWSLLKGDSAVKVAEYIRKILE
ncbi:hypothetical protein CKM354_000795900 [Cercospora kikuchii]|uniref:Polyketide synthase n=1 Tax=Cercospora kikuchii TaxID=84275 RepID=A0A9P3CS54_9PEZI|nr:uncharacterized protein CKM354_000795900 [Cercospora kikuchii]GIZ44770.1 hypothetical protein CKM354_000795900 [Cercospora kikuchii]